MVTIELGRTVISKALESSDSVFVTKDELGREIDAFKTASQTGRHIGVVDADDDYYEVRVLHASDAGASFCVAQRDDAQDEDDVLSVSIAQSGCSADRMKTIVRAATELGATELLPLITERSRSVGALEWQQLDKLVTKASLLAGLSHQPRFRDPASLADAIGCIGSYDLVIVFWERAAEVDAYVSKMVETAQRAFSNDSPLRIALIFGPEGGLTDDEVAMCLKAGDNVVCASLGSTVLSCDTATITAMAQVQCSARRVLNALRLPNESQQP